jgi:hypothetical protein
MDLNPKEHVMPITPPRPQVAGATAPIKPITAQTPGNIPVTSIRKNALPPLAKTPGVSTAKTPNVDKFAMVRIEKSGTEKDPLIKVFSLTNNKLLFSTRNEASATTWVTNADHATLMG